MKNNASIERPCITVTNIFTEFSITLAPAINDYYIIIKYDILDVLYTSYKSPSPVPDKLPAHLQNINNKIH